MAAAKKSVAVQTPNKNYTGPSFNRVLVKPLPANDEGLIQIQDRSAFVRGVVVAAGPLAGIRNEKVFHTFVVGQTILYNRMSAIPYGNNPAEMLHLIDDNVVFVFE